MVFLNPSFLWALLGLSIPVAIHLWSKKEGRTIRIGSIQLLRESDPKKTSNIKLNELWLLLLRMLLLTTLVFILAEPRFENDTENSRITYLVEPSLLQIDGVNSILDTLPDNVPVKLLQSGFPEFKISDIHPDDYFPPNYWQLATEMEDLPTDSIIVFTSAYFTGFKGKRPQVGKIINWVNLDPGETEREIVKASLNGEEVELTWIVSDHSSLKFEKNNISRNSDRIKFSAGNDSISVLAEGKEKKIAINPVDSISVLIVASEDFEDEIKYLKSSYSAIANYLDQPVNVHVVNVENFFNSSYFNTVVWLSDSPAPEISGNMLAYTQDSLANSLIEPGRSVKEFHLTHRLNSENVVEEDLPERLLILLDLNIELEQKIPQYDQRVMDPQELQPIYTAGVAGKTISETTNIAIYLWLFFLVLLLAERGLAFYRKQ